MSFNDWSSHTDHLRCKVFNWQEKFLAKNRSCPPNVHQMSFVWGGDSDLEFLMENFDNGFEVDIKMETLLAIIEKQL